MPISSNNTHISFNNNSTQNTAFLGTIAAANITGQITAPQIAPGVVPAGGFFNMFVSDTAGPGTWTAPPTTTKIRVSVAGGGGGSGSSVGSGGGGGGVAIKIIPVVGGTPYPYTIGAGGTAGSAPVSSAGGAGGTTSFGSPASTSATGGAGGLNAPCGCQSVVNGGIGSSGDLNLRGGTGIRTSIGVPYMSPCGGGTGYATAMLLGGGNYFNGTLAVAPSGGSITANPFGQGAVGFGPATPFGSNGLAGGRGGIIIEF